MAEEVVSDIRCPDLSKGPGPQALCNAHFEGLRGVFNDLKGQNVFAEVTGVSRPGIVGCEIVTGEVVGSVLTRLQSSLKGHLIQGFQEMVFPKFFGELLKYRDQTLVGKVVDFLKSHVRVFQKLVLGDGFDIHDHSPPVW
jgi:hypothetical protein